jgi:hypothetical protein
VVLVGNWVRVGNAGTKGKSAVRIPHNSPPRATSRPAAQAAHHIDEPPLLIEHVVTADDFDGAPVVPGFIDDGILWACIRRLPNHMTLWCRIILQATKQPDTATLDDGLSNQAASSRRKTRED